MTIEYRTIVEQNPCAIYGHYFLRIGRTNLMRCGRCDKIIYKEFEKKGLKLCQD